MEKYARQAVSEGLQRSEDIHVNKDSEIYRVLNLHYNRNNHIEVSAEVNKFFGLHVTYPIKSFLMRASRNSHTLENFDITYSCCTRKCFYLFFFKLNKTYISLF